MQLNCSIQKVNPKIDNFSWQYCDPEISICDPKNDRMWKHVHSDYVTFKEANLTFSLVLDGQHQQIIHYRCKAKNILGTDQISFVIIKVEGNVNIVFFASLLACTVIKAVLVSCYLKQFVVILKSIINELEFQFANRELGTWLRSLSTWCQQREKLLLSTKICSFVYIYTPWAGCSKDEALVERR